MAQPEHEYRGEHGAPGPDDAPLWDLTGGDIYPKDVYIHGQRYYGAGDGSDNGAWSIVYRWQGYPLGMVRIYRAVPRTLKRVKIAPGDWVTIERKYATEHGRSHLRNEFRIIEARVHAGDLFTDGNSIMEWGYWPMPEEQRVQFERERIARRVAKRLGEAV